MTQRIEWLTKGTAVLPSLDFNDLERWLSDVAKAHNRVIGHITYIFCDDDTILDVNRQFLNHDYYTDIITFDDSRGRLINGDIFLSLDTVATNAVAVGSPYNVELHRVIAHGVLHLCGINDKGPGEREIMESHENEALKLIKLQ